MKIITFGISVTALFCVASAFAQDHKLGYDTTPYYPGSKWRVHDSSRPRPGAITPSTCNAQKGKAPSDAEVLFDGHDLSKFVSMKGGVAGEPGWKLGEGVMEVIPGKGDIFSKEAFGDMQIHLEWASPSEVKGDSQNRGNSGLKISGLYEIQILDSYKNPTYPDGQAGALYGQTPPLVNASKPPGEWQTYDILWEGPRWDAEGKLVRKASVTVLHNGLVLHHKRELVGFTNHKNIPPYKPHPPHGYIELYEHGNPVRFRNIWLRPLGEYDKP